MVDWVLQSMRRLNSPITEDFFEATYKTDSERFKMFAEVLRIAKGDLIEIATPEQIKALAR